MGSIDEVKQRTDIVEVIGQYTTLKKAGRTFRGLCPFHSEKRPSFFVYPEQQSWHCFGACNTGGDVFSFIMKKEGIDFGEALRLLAERAGVIINSRFEPEAGKEERDRLYQVNQAATQYFQNLLLNSPEAEPARNYLAKRGFQPKTVADFQLGFSLKKWGALKQYLSERDYSGSELLTAGLVIEAESGDTHDRFRNRLIFPITDIRGRIVGFGGRVLDDSSPKYLNSPQTPAFDKSSCLYGINLAKEAIRQQDQAVVVEGYMDVLTAHQNGFNNVVASMGIAVTGQQVGTLKKLSRNMALALDADAAGEEATLRAVGHENILDAEVKVIIMPEGKDPDEVIKEDAKLWQQLMAEAIPIVDFTFNMATSALDLDTPRGKSLAVVRIGPIVYGMKDEVRRNHYLQKLAHIAGVTPRQLEAILREKAIPDKRAAKPEPTAASQPMRSLVSPVEEDCLTLLLQHPELRTLPGPPPEHFENSENREIFTAWQQAGDLPELREKVDSAIREHLEDLAARNRPADQIEIRYTDYVRSLEKEFLRSYFRKRAAVSSQEDETEGASNGPAKPDEQDVALTAKLREVFTQQNRGGKSQGDKNEPRR